MAVRDVFQHVGEAFRQRTREGHIVDQRVRSVRRDGVGRGQHGVAYRQHLRSVDHAQQRIGRRTGQRRCVNSAVVVQRDRVVHDIAYLALGVTGLGHTEVRLEQVCWATRRGVRYVSDFTGNTLDAAVCRNCVQQWIRVAAQYRAVGIDDVRFSDHRRHISDVHQQRIVDDAAEIWRAGDGVGQGDGVIDVVPDLGEVVATLYQFDFRVDVGEFAVEYLVSISRVIHCELAFVAIYFYSAFVISDGTGLDIRQIPIGLRSLADSVITFLQHIRKEHVAAICRDRDAYRTERNTLRRGFSEGHTPR